MPKLPFVEINLFAWLVGITSSNVGVMLSEYGIMLSQTDIPLSKI